jgi:type II secretory pathway pseudopilin PulG
MPRINLLAVFSLLTMLAMAIVIRAQKPSIGVADRERERRSLAVNVVRAINTAEASYKNSHGTYANWDTLFGNGDFSENGTKWASESFPTVAHAMYGRATEIVPGWKLRLNLSNNGNSYDLLLEDATDPKCGYAVVSDDRGVIRQSKTIECPI